MEQYLEKLLSQIRCKKARPYIAEELKGHIECQIEDNMQEGMSHVEAERKAVEDMGDPIEVGISLDRIHKPRIAWGLLLLVSIISVLGIWVQQSICHQKDFLNLEEQQQMIFQLYGDSFVELVVMGVVLMCVVYFLDYTRIAKWAKVIGLFIIAMGVLVVVGFFGTDINGVRYRVGFGAFRVAAIPFMMLYVPIYGGILYKHRNGGWVDFIKAIVWLMIPVIITFAIPNVTAAGVMFISMLFQLTVAVSKGWFRIPVKRTLIGLWTAVLVLPVTIFGMMYSFHLLKWYQEERIRSFLNGAGDGFYITDTIRTLLKKVQWIGNSEVQVIGNLPEFNSDYIFTYVLSTYGMLAGLLIVLVLASLIFAIFGAVFRQKNQLGLIMGVGCGVLILVNMGINLLGAVGAIPPASSFLPFFSLGRDNILLCYVLVGIVLSIYRYKDVYPANVNDIQMTIKKEFTINI